MIFEPEFLTNKNIPLFEYPRPQLKRDSYFCLNGIWDYKILKENSLLKQGKINVPYSPECELSGVLTQLKKDQTLIYERNFTLPSDFNKGVVLLNFGACDQVTKVYLNDKFVGENQGGYLPFSFDITPFLKEENLLRVEVIDDAGSPIYGRGKQSYKRGGIWYTATSGIWQTVFIESVPTNYIKSIKLLPNYDDKTLSVTVNAIGENKNFKVEIVDNGEVIALGSGENNVVLDVSNCKPWSVDCPELYKIYVYLGNDKIESYFGLRKFSVIEKNGVKLFALNNKPIFHNGLLDQGYFNKGLYTPQSNQAMYNEIKAVKDLNFNMLRKHIKVEPLLWYYYCDILGVLVWQDMINGGEKYKTHRIILAPFINLRLNDKNYKSMGRSQASREQYYKEAYALQDLLYNSVCVCLYTPFNEAWGQFDCVEVTKKLKQRDGSRLYDHASGWQDNGGGDVYSRHIYFRKAKPKNDKKRVLALTEFGGYSLHLKEHSFSDKKFGYKTFKNKEGLLNAYKNLYINQVIPLIKKQGLSATVYTQLTDVEDEINGIFTFDRVLKIDKNALENLNREVIETFDEIYK